MGAFQAIAGGHSIELDGSSAVLLFWGEYASPAASARVDSGVHIRNRSGDTLTAVVRRVEHDALSRRTRVYLEMVEKRECAP